MRANSNLAFTSVEYNGWVEKEPLVAKVNIEVKALVKGKETKIQFKNTRELLNYLARTGAIVTTDKTIVVV